MKITADMLVVKGACADPVALFRRMFPNGAVWPRDATRAARAGLDVARAVQMFRLSGIVRSCRADGKLGYVEHYRDGKLHGVRRWYYADGKLWHVEQHWRNGNLHGVRRSCRADGKLWHVEHYRDGKLHGVQRWDDENGKPRYVSHWRDGEIID